MVCTAVLIMRRTHPEAERPFRCPMSPLIPILGVATCLLLMFALPVENWWRLGIWLAIGFGIYFSYGKFHGVMSRSAVQPPEVALTPIAVEQPALDP
jgi:APA family basic amino acid/polyamine antiporter